DSSTTSCGRNADLHKIKGCDDANNLNAERFYAYPAKKMRAPGAAGECRQVVPRVADSGSGVGGDGVAADRVSQRPDDPRGDLVDRAVDLRAGGAGVAAAAELAGEVGDVDRVGQGLAAEADAGLRALVADDFGDHGDDL